MKSLAGSLTVLTVLIILLLGTAIPMQAQEGGFHESFDDPAMPGWERSPDAEVAEGVLRLGPDGFAFRGGAWADLELMVRARKDGEGELIVHYRASDQGSYMARLGPGFIALLREESGEISELAAREIDFIPPGEWSQILVSVAAGEHAVWLNGEQVLTANDPNPLPSGSVGLRFEGEGAAEFDELILEAAGGPEPEQSEEEGPEQPGETPAEEGQPSGQLTWVRTGGPLGGLGYDVRMRPDDPDTMYVTDANAGVFKSTDGGKAWFPSNTGITTRTGPSSDLIPVFSLTIDPNDYDTLWIGTQNVRGIFKSTDGGKTWVEMDNGVVEYEGITFRGFTVEPSNSDVVYAAAEIASFAWSDKEELGREFDKTQGVVYKTTDGGQNWTAIWRGNNLARYIWINPEDTQVIYISTGIFDREAADSDHLSDTPGGEGVLKSTDAGQTWQAVNNGLGNLYVGSLFMHPEDPDTLLAGTGNNAYLDKGGVYLTTDGGASWDYVLKDENINSVEFSLTDPDIAYAGSMGTIYRSEDRGRTWERVSEQEGWGSPGVLGGFPIDFQVDPRDSDRIFANNYGGGNFVSEDGGATWEDASRGYTGALARAIAVAPDDPATVYVSARSGIFYSTNAGQQWLGLNTWPNARAIEWNAVAIDPQDGQHILAANNLSGNILESQDGGQTWQNASEHIQDGIAWRSFAYAPSDPQIVYAGSGAFSTGGGFNNELDSVGIYVSKDRGSTWQPANDASTQGAQVAGLAVDPEDPQVVYAAATKRGLLKTGDGGQSWTQLASGLPDSYMAVSVAVSPKDSNLVYLGLDFGGMYRSRDGGSTWEQVSAGYNPEASISAILFSPSNPDHIYAADRFTGVHLSRDGGETWETINDGLRNRNVNALAFSADGQHLYAATEGEGVFRLDLSGQPPAGALEIEEGEQAQTPTAEPTAGEGRGFRLPCIGNALLPVAGVGWLWLRRRRKRT